MTSWLRGSVVKRTVMNEDACGEGDRYGYGWHLAHADRSTDARTGSSTPEAMAASARHPAAARHARDDHGRQLQPVPACGRTFSASSPARRSAAQSSRSSQGRRVAARCRRSCARRSAERHAEHSRNLRGGVRDECGFVALAAHRHRREIGAVGLEHDVVDADGAHRLAQRLGVRESYDAADAQQQAELARRRSAPAPASR